MEHWSVAADASHQSDTPALQRCVPSRSLWYELVGCRLFKADDSLAGPGVAEFFAGYPLHRFWIAEGFYRVLQLSVFFCGLLKFGIEPQHLLAHPFVLPDEGKVPDGKTQKTRGQKKDHDESREFAPDAGINVHRSQLIRGRAAAEGDNLTLRNSSRF